jgi:hypothetical protein
MKFNMEISFFSVRSVLSVARNFFGSGFAGVGKNR